MKKATIRFWRKTHSLIGQICNKKPLQPIVLTGHATCASRLRHDRQNKLKWICPIVLGLGVPPRFPAVYSKVLDHPERMIAIDVARC